MKFTKIKCIGLCCVSGVLLASYLPKTIVSADAIGGKLTVGTSTLTANTKNNTVAESLTSSDQGDSKVLYVHYPVGQCTWGVKELAPWAGTFWGNAASWTYSAAAEGFSTGTTPTVGAIAVWSGGHVAYVTAVESESNIQVMESNYAGIQGIGNYRGWFNPIGAQGSVTYIYPPSGL